MTAWPEGRVEFVCTGPAEGDGSGQRWMGEVLRQYCRELLPIVDEISTIQQSL